jgi:tetratricopeptide (TPR) repeat protein
VASKKEQLSTDLAKFVEQSQWAKAVECLQGLVDLEPKKANYYLRMGDYNVKAGNKSGAVKAYYRAAQLFVDSGFSVKGIATYKMILRLAPEEKQAQQLMRAINSSPAVASALVSLPPLAPEAPAPPPSLAPEVPAPLLPSTPAAPPSPVVEAVPPPPPPPPPRVEVAPPSARKVPPPPLKVAPPPALEPEPELVLELEPEVEVMASEQLEVKKDINPLFAAFTEEEFGAIVDKLEPLQFMAGERMITEGDEGDAMYLISRGGGRVIKEIDGQEVVLDELGEGEFFGEMSLLVGGPRSASVFATADTEVLRLKSSDLFEVIKQYPRIENALEQFYDKRSKATRQKMKQVRK